MTIINTIAGLTFTDKRLMKKGADLQLTGGTLYMDDLGNPASHPSQNTTLTGLTDLAFEEALTTVRSGTTVTFGGGGLEMNAIGSTGWHLEDDRFDLSEKQEHTMLYLVWFNRYAAGNDSNAKPILALKDMNSAGVPTDTTSAFSLMHSPANTLSAYVAGQRASLTMSVDDAVVQVGCIVRRDADMETSVLSYFLNAEKQADFVLSYVEYAAPVTPGLIRGRTPSPYSFGSMVTWNGKFYRALVEDCTESGRDPEYWIARDYAANADRFS